VFGAPLAIEGLAAFFLESTFLGLWIFGWNRLPKRVHLSTIWLAALGTWLSAYFILVANSWMQHPVGYKVENGQAQLTSVWQLLTGKWGLWALGHTIFAGLTTAAMVILGVACWHILRGRNQEIFKKAVKLALIVAVPISAFNLWFGSNFGIVITELQPMKISAAEALWDTEKPASFSMFQIGGFTEDDQEPVFDIEIPYMLSFLATGSFTAEVVGMNQIQDQYRQQYGPGTYTPPVWVSYWAMRVMAYVGTLILAVAALGAFLYWRRRLESTKWFLWAGVLAIPLPFIACLAGWILTEVGRQPWIVQGLLKTVNANSPSVGTATIAFSLSIFITLYLILAVVDFVLMRRYARVDPPESEDGAREAPAPAAGF